jgi:hypothetical protein
MSSQFEKDQLAVKNAVQYEANLSTYRLWLSQHEEVAPVEANQRIFEEYLDFAGEELVPANFDFTLNNLRTRLALRKIPTPAQRKAALMQKPVGELVAMVKAARPSYVGFPQLAKSVVKQGTVVAVPLDSQYLQKLDAWELKKYLKIYGSEQINNRLAGKE